MARIDKDEELLELYARHRDASAFDRLVRRHHRSAYRRACALLGDPGAAEDVVQEAFVAVLRSAGRFRSGERFAPWFSRILLNKARDAARRRDRRRRHEAAWAPPEAEQGSPDGAQALRKHLAMLPFEQRAALTLHYLEGLGHRRVADELDWRPGSVSGRIRRGLESLKASLTAAGYGALAPRLEADLRGLASAIGTGRRPEAIELVALARGPQLAAAAKLALGLLALAIGAAWLWSGAEPADSAPRRASQARLSWLAARQDPAAVAPEAPSGATGAPTAPAASPRAKPSPRGSEALAAGHGILVVEVFEDGAPIGERLCSGRLDSSTIGIGAPARFQERCDASGRLRFSELPEGDYALTFQVEGSRLVEEKQRFRIRSGSVTRRRVDRRSDCVVEGALRYPAGLKPEVLAASLVDLDSRQSRDCVWSVSAGRYQCRGVGPGRYELRLRGGELWGEVAAAVVFEDGRIAEGPELDLRSGAALRGEVYATDGSSLAEARLELRRIDVRGWESCEPEDGRFRFYGLPPGHYRLKIRGDLDRGLAPQVLAEFRIAGRDVNLGAIAVTVRPSLATRVEVTVLDAEGRPVKEEPCFPWETKPERIGRGVYLFTGLSRRNDHYSLSAWTKDGRMMSDRVTFPFIDGRGAVTLRLTAPSAGLTLELDAPAALRARTGEVAIFSMTGSGKMYLLRRGEDGLYRNGEPIKPGPYHFFLEGGRVGEPFSLAPGERRRMVLPFQRGQGRVRIRVRGLEPDPLGTEVVASWFDSDGSVAGRHRRYITLGEGETLVDLERLGPGATLIELPDLSVGRGALFTLRRMIELQDDQLTELTLEVPPRSEFGALRCVIPAGRAPNETWLYIYNDRMLYTRWVDRGSESEGVEVEIPEIFAGSYRVLIGPEAPRPEGGAVVRVAAGAETVLEATPVVSAYKRSARR